ncbi:hypothetical protein [Mesorhizobium sp. M0019]|uniref:c-type cytochrome n=1 Tax=Mesorhizobium sp. M0019 TaxID=2956845 RepID=UPI0033368133
MMRPSLRRLSTTLFWLLRLFAHTASVVLLVGSVAWLFAEWHFSEWTPATAEEAFKSGSLGLEIMPVKYALVIDEVSGSAFRSGRQDAPSLWRSYGFLDNPRAGLDSKPACAGNAVDKLPVGFNISHRAPARAFGTPINFVGLTCATCHTAKLTFANGRESDPILGVGNQELDLIAWTDSLKIAVLDPQLSVSKILDAYDRRCGAPAGLYDRTIGNAVERIIISAWLAGIRGTVGGDFPRIDLPYSGLELRNGPTEAIGPGRTRAFRGIVRIALDVPGSENAAISKIPVVFEQTTKLRRFSQYDGGIGSADTRALIAAFAAGSSVEALSKPEVAHNIRSAARFTETLGIEVKVPGYADLFPDLKPTEGSVARGAEVYQRACNSCHGHRPAADQPWSLSGADQINRIMPAITVPGAEGIGTDTARLNFRYAGALPLAIWAAFPGSGDLLSSQKAALSDAATKAENDLDFGLAFLWREKLATLIETARRYPQGHPLAFQPAEIRSPAGYVNNPIPRAYLRAPYLHNGSVPTMRQLINLDRRPETFCRGRNQYDPIAVGLIAPVVGDDGRCPEALPFLFDTKAAGNSNLGHDYPWRYDDPARDGNALRDLLEYLKIL